MYKEIKRHNKLPLFKDLKKEKTYTKFKGGWSWPREKQAFICILAEEHNTGCLHLVYEGRENSLLNLGKRLITLREEHPVEDYHWVADVEGPNKNFEEMLYDITRSEDLDRSILPSQPDMIQDFHSALEMLRKNSQQNLLYLRKEGILLSLYKKLKQKETVESDFQEKYPEIMVLANVVKEFPRYEVRVKKYLPKDPYPEFFEDDDEPEPYFKIW